MDVSSIRKQVVRDFTEVYQVNDKAHRVEHFRDVEACGFTINSTLGLGYDPKLIMLVAYFHDMFAWSRNNHHDLSAEWVAGTDYQIIAELTDKDRAMVAAGCREHRASRKEAFSSEFTELMNSADRGVPSSVEQMMQRAIDYRLARGATGEQAIEGARVHLKEKYDYGGYVKYSPLYLKVFGEKLERVLADIKAL